MSILWAWGSGQFWPIEIKIETSPHVKQDTGFWTVEIESLNQDCVKIEILGHKPCQHVGFLNCWDVIDSLEMGFGTVETKSLDQDHVYTNLDLQA